MRVACHSHFLYLLIPTPQLGFQPTYFKFYLKYIAVSNRKYVEQVGDFLSIVHS
jgi:hypothetical protein